MPSSTATRISIIDSHTGGEPTRVVIDGAPDLGKGTVAERLERLKTSHDWLRRSAIDEPRGSDVLVGALLIPPADPACVAGVIYFNNVGYLGMCGHGTIGVGATLAHLGRIKPGKHRLETNVGEVTITLHEDGSVSVTNVPSYRKIKSHVIEIPGLGAVRGDVVWSGNWFYLVDAAQLSEPSPPGRGQGEGAGNPRSSSTRHPHPNPLPKGEGALQLTLDNVDDLTAKTWQIRQAVNRDIPEVDHIELYGPPLAKNAHCKNFVLCPGKAYDRSPCGTGTSAKLACLAADGKLAEGEEWIQESIVGSVFSGRYKWLDREKNIIEPTIRGTAYVTAETTLILDEADPFKFGLKDI